MKKLQWAQFKLQRELDVGEKGEAEVPCSHVHNLWPNSLSKTM